MAYNSDRRITNADIPIEGVPVNYNRLVSNVAPPNDQQVFDEVRAITEGHSNPPSASQSLSSLLDGPEDPTDSPVQLIPPVTEYPTAATFADQAVTMATSHQGHLLCCVLA